MSDQNEQTLDWIAIAEHVERELETDRTTASEYVLEWVLVHTQNDPNYDRNAIPYSDLDVMMEIIEHIHRVRQSHEDAAVRDLIQGLEESQRRKNEAEQHGDWQTSEYDPKGELEHVDAEVLAGDDAEFVTNESAKRFIEKRLLLSLVALNGTERLDDAAKPNIMEGQPEFATATDIAVMNISELSQFLADVVEGSTVII